MELIERSMVQPIKTIQVHDLLRELAISKAKEDRFLDIIHEDSNARFLAKECRLLQVLDLEGVYMALLDSSVGNLIHLRYLDLRKTWLKKLPSSMGNLFNLQSLDLSSTLVDPIPLLKHVCFNEFREMVVNPPVEASLPNLQKLIGTEMVCSSGRFSHLQFLKLSNIRVEERSG
ncbi:hypothetical protein CISIN_1g047314mg [Citrus sinensis]|uniref:Disease resistance R13L4/SHOC-2-like LRR domain-containing protein n=1 Tax=Citrus sinensis TaxID=2711 RepID=A0A067FQV5_CITSI|nr:hypothetical protein CISIN_1g047314mg [Citrus sinensis]